MIYEGPNSNYHTCGNPDMEWDGDYKVTAEETLERRGYCKNCKKRIRERVLLYFSETIDHDWTKDKIIKQKQST